MRFLLATILTAVTVSAAAAAEFTVTPGAPNRVTFTSKAATETFGGDTDRIRGRIVVDPGAVGDSVTVFLEVDLASLDTGIGLRNTHMRNNHLETDRFPNATFAGAAVLAPAAAVLAPEAAVTFEVEGTFTLHGVSKRLRVPVTVTLRDERTLAFETEFPVTLADYAISRPKFLFLKLGETQAVTVSGVATVAD